MKPFTMCVHEEHVCWWLLKRSFSCLWNQQDMLHSNEYVKLSGTFYSSAWPLQGFMIRFPCKAVSYLPLCTALTVGRSHEEHLTSLSLGRLLLSKYHPMALWPNLENVLTLWECVGWHSLLITAKKHQPFISNHTVYKPTFCWLRPHNTGHKKMTNGSSTNYLTKEHVYFCHQYRYPQCWYWGHPKCCQNSCTVHSFWMLFLAQGRKGKWPVLASLPMLLALP